MTSRNEQDQTQNASTLRPSEKSRQPSPEIPKFDWSTLAGREKRDSIWRESRYQKLIQTVVGGKKRANEEPSSSGQIYSVKVPEISVPNWNEAVTAYNPTEKEIKKISRYHEHPPSWATTCCKYCILDFACSSLTRYRIVLAASLPRLGTII